MRIDGEVRRLDIRACEVSALMARMMIDGMEERAASVLHRTRLNPDHPRRREPATARGFFQIGNSHLRAVIYGNIMQCGCLSGYRMSLSRDTKDKKNLGGERHD